MARTSIAVEPFSFSGDLVSAGSGKWSYLTTDGISMAANGSTVSPDYDFIAYARWAGSGTFSDDQYAEIKITGNVGRAGVLVRASADVDAGRDFYVAYQQGGSDTWVGKTENGTFTWFMGYGSGGTPSTSHTWANGDKMSLEVQGSSPATIRLYKTPSGGSLTLLDTFSDTGPTTGKPGLMGSGTITAIDDFEAGDVFTPAVNLPAIMHHLRQQGICP